MEGAEEVWYVSGGDERIAIFLRHLIPLRNEDTIRRRKSVPGQLYPIHQNERHDRGHQYLLYVKSFTFPPPLFLFLHLASCILTPTRPFTYLHSLCHISFILTPVTQIILSASTSTAINIHPRRIYFNNVTLMHAYTHMLIICSSVMPFYIYCSCLCLMFHYILLNVFLRVSLCAEVQQTRSLWHSGSGLDLHCCYLSNKQSKQTSKKWHLSTSHLSFS